MASILFMIKSKKNPAHIYARFSNGRGNDFPAGTGLYVNPEYWDQEKQKIRNVIAVPNRDKINSKLSKLSTHIIDQYNLDYSEGEIIDQFWLKATISAFFKRPKGEETKQNIDHHIYFTDYCYWWLKTKADTWKVNSEEFMSEKSKYYYESMVDLFVEFQGKEKKKIKEVGKEVLSSFVDYLIDVKKYKATTADQNKTKAKFFCNRILADGIKINPDFKDSIYSRNKEQVFKEPFLSDAEIELIYNYDFTYNKVFDNVKDSFIIGLRTGLRASDFNTNLKMDNIVDGYFEICTQKTKKWVVIPIHPEVEEILKKRNGQLPRKYSTPWFNDNIKEICRIVGIQKEMKGSLMNPDTRRKEIGVYPKYKLVSSHICRRSFATNNYGLVDNKILMDIGGWDTESVFIHYVKTSKHEQAEIFKQALNKKNISI